MTFAADLDGMLAEFGRPATLRRVVGTGANQTYVDCHVQAFIPRQSTDMLMGATGQAEFMAIVSASDITRAQWPGGQAVQSPPAQIDPRIPRLTDRFIIDGRERTIIGVDPLFDGGELYRVNLRVKG